MARSVIKLEGEEIEFFHTNYFYMWKKLNTAPYYVSGSGELPQWIKEPELLPSYVNLSKCMNPTYVPSVNIVNKIVAFYNANIQPEVTTFQFLHEKLEATDEQRSTSGGVSIEKFEGLYYGYYFSGNKNDKVVYGAIFKISNINNTAIIQMITGITDRDDLKSLRLRSLFDAKDISLTEYKKYRDSLPLSKRRIALYKGGVRANNITLEMQLQNIEKEGNFLMAHCPTASPFQNQFFGSVGLMTMIQGTRDIEILKFGLERADHKDLKALYFEDEALKDLLAFEKSSNEHIHLSVADNSDWNDLLLDSCNN